MRAPALPRLRALAVAAVLGPLATCVAASADSASAEGEADRVYAVGVKEAPPFAMRDAQGAWTGLSVELWRQAADALDLRYRLEPRGLSELLDAVAAGELDVGLGALTLTPDRERALDFTHPFLATGLGIAVPRGGGLLAALRGLLTPAFWASLGGLLSLLLGVGLLFWLAERRRNPEQLGGGLRGVGTGFWWSAVTMTTVGYGDVVPRSPLGRAVGVVWMFASVIVISAFTAAIASSLTVSRLGSAVSSPDDLHDVRVGTADATAAAEQLGEAGIAYRAFPDVAEALAALARDQLDAVVYDAPLLRYQARERFPDEVRMLPFTVARQDYALALPEGSALREPLNRALLDAILSPDWGSVLRRYLGERVSAPE